MTRSSKNEEYYKVKHWNLYEWLLDKFYYYIDKLNY